jgi:hypothetical protein
MVTLSLLVAAKGPCRAGPFFDALAATGALADPRVEVHLAQDATTALDAPAPAGVAVSTLPETVSVFRLWGEAAAASAGRHLALLDIHCPPEPGWLAVVLDRLAADPEAFYGPVEPAYSASDPRIVGYLVEYAQFHRPIDPAMPEAAGNNIVFRRALAGTPEALATTGLVKTLVLQRLEAAPGRLDRAVVRHGKPFAAGHYLARRYRHGRCYAAERMRQPTAPSRLLALASTPLLPALRVWRIHRHARRIEALRRAFWRRLPTILAAEAAWSVGEALGYVAGEGGCRARLD